MHRSRLAGFIMDCRTDDREQPYDRRGNESRTYASDDGRERTARCVHVAKSAGDEVLSLRKSNDHRCRRQRKCEQSEHVSP